MDLYLKNAFETGIVTTRNYSTSFSLGIKLFKKKYRLPIYAIYAFVRFADEIVDTFHKQNRQKLFDEFVAHTYQAIEERISMNPVLHAFQHVVNTYNIDTELIDAFLKSMEADLHKTEYNSDELQTYIYGSAEVVGLMCLKIFYRNNPQQYDKLKKPARKLGEAFQKINFLRDIKDDYQDKGRLYFHQVDFRNFKAETKKQIEDEIAADFREAEIGIKQLKKGVRPGVTAAFYYYKSLLKKIQKTPPQNILEKRYRISDFRKIMILIGVYIRNFI